MIIAGAGVQGTGHLAAGRGCQDAFKAVDLGGTAVLAVADGAGSRDRSALGAHLAVDVACRVLEEEIPHAGAPADEWTRWTAAAGSRLATEWLRSVEAVLSATPSEPRVARTSPEAPEPQGSAVGIDAGALAATVAAVVVRPPWAAFVSVGDCTGTVLTRDAAEVGERCHLVLAPPMPDGPPPVFLSSPGAGLRVRTFVVWEPDLSGVVLATDGCTALTLDHPSVRGLPPQAGPLPSERFFCGLAATLRANGGDAEPLRSLLSGPQAARTGDDLTVLCALLDGG